MAIALIAGGLYGAWVALEHYDNVRATYREELARSRTLNFTNQQRISDLLKENEVLRAQLTIIEEIPVGNFDIDGVGVDDPVRPIENANVGAVIGRPQTDEELEDEENVRH